MSDKTKTGIHDENLLVHTVSRVVLFSTHGTDTQLFVNGLHPTSSSTYHVLPEISTLDLFLNGLLNAFSVLSPTVLNLRKTLKVLHVSKRDLHVLHADCFACSLIRGHQVLRSITGLHR